MTNALDAGVPSRDGGTLAVPPTQEPSSAPTAPAVTSTATASTSSPPTWPASDPHTTLSTTSPTVTHSVTAPRRGVSREGGTPPRKGQRQSAQFRRPGEASGRSTKPCASNQAPGTVVAGVRRCSEALLPSSPGIRCETTCTGRRVVDDRATPIERWLVRALTTIEARDEQYYGSRRTSLIGPPVTPGSRTSVGA